MTFAGLQLIATEGSVAPVLLVGSSITIGRSPENAVHIQDERASRAHCVIERRSSGQWVIKDLKSRNGTKVNQVKIEEHILRVGDVVRIGKHEFRVESTAPVRSALSIDEVVGEHRKSAPSIEETQEGTWKRSLLEVIDSLPPKSVHEPMIIVDAQGDESDVFEGEGDGPLALRLILQIAIKSRATDLHVEPKSEKFQFRLRIDGDMVSVVDTDRRVGELLYGVVKSACHMHVAGRDAVQDGHFSTKLNRRRIDYRVSFTPSVHGQKLVIRVLDPSGAPSSLDDLGMAPYMLDRVRQVIGQDSGLLLSVGPTGSGKTTTLYNAIREIDRETSNVVTIEDPVEYHLDNTTQIPIDDHKGNTFGSLLRSVLRQDPDVILVGEIRDEETARTAMQASLTGHLVFSSLHAKDSIAAVFRLLDLKVEPYLVANALNLVLAQRLVRMLCPQCKREISMTPGQATRVGRFIGPNNRIFSATGCARCLRTGYRGRRALYELLDVNDELRDIILNNPSINAMKKVIEEGLFTTLQQSGWRLVGEGVTTLDEIERVAGMT